MPLSVVINTKNAAKTLEACLQSVVFADEIVVVDMHSTDETVKIAKKFTNKIFTHPDLGYADPARDWAISKASYDWILVIDADEQVSSTLQKKIQKIVIQEEAADVYLIPRKNIIFGQWIKSAGWWLDYQPRLFKKGHVSWKVGVHRRPDLKGVVKKFPAQQKFALVHQNYQTIEQFIERLNRYTSIQAKERQEKSNADEASGFSPSSLLKTWFDELQFRAFKEKGLSQGTHGMSLSLLQAFYELTVMLKQWQLTGFKAQKTNPRHFTKTLCTLKKELSYWTADWQVQRSFGLKRIYWQIRRKLKI
jgi:glycosyltransferase involved in cell wall biosynthesis